MRTESAPASTLAAPLSASATRRASATRSIGSSGSAPSSIRLLSWPTPTKTGARGSRATIFGP